MSSAHATTVLVLAGGDSAERDVSLASAQGIADALLASGYRVLVADPARPQLQPDTDHTEFFKESGIKESPPETSDDAFNDRAEFTRVLSAHQAYGIDVVFSGLHGGAGEDGTIQAIMEYVGVPFVGSGSAACALAMDKQRSKHIAAAAAVPVIRGVLLDQSALASGTLEQTVRETVGIPAIVKPNSQGSSVGLSKVEQFSDLDAAAASAIACDDHILVEEYIAGREVTQAIVDGEPDIPILEIRPKSGFYDYYHKYQAGNSEYIVPAPLEPEVARHIHDAAHRTYHALGLRDYARVDFRLDEDGTPHLLEANTLPGMTATSLVPKSCAPLGITYQELCDRLVRLALGR